MWCQATSKQANSFAASDAGGEMAIEGIRQKASTGHLREELELAGDYYAGRGVTRDLSQAAYWYKKAAEQGDPGAEVEVGYFFLTGTGVKPDAEQAAKWFQRASASGSRIGKLNLAVLYLRGVGVRQDARLSLKLLNELGESGDPRGEAYLGLVYMLGVGVEANPDLAERWFISAAQHRSPEGNYAMGTLYSVAKGHPHDLQRAVAYLRESADSGYMFAMHSLGLLLVNHPELPQHAGEATTLLEKAAGGGAWRSSVVLAILYRDGKLVPKDPCAAYRWLKIAQSQGGNDADRVIHSDIAVARDALSADQQKQSESAAVEWMGAHPHTNLFVINGGKESAFFPIEEVYSTELAQAESSTGASVR
jgi:uncharacterized protein